MKTKKGSKGVKKPQTKIQNKRIKTFNSSEFSLLQDKHHSALDFRLFKNEGITNRKDNLHSALSQYASTNTQPKTNIPKKKKKPKLKIKQQQYEHFKLEDLSNASDIIFSYEESKKASSVLVNGNINKQLKIHDTYVIDESKMLKLTIRKEYQRKVEAATKIQKVFRGYMTRKILMKYVKNQQQKILKQLFNKTVRDCDKEIQDESHEGTFRDVAFTRQIDDRFNHQIRPRQEFAEDYERDQDSSSEESSSFGYRHKQAVYSHEEISKFLSQSSQDIYEPEIIFETNDEYIDSRKSSLQNKNQPINKLSKNSIRDETIQKYDENQEYIEAEEEGEQNSTQRLNNLQQLTNKEQQSSDRSISQFETSEIQESIIKLKEEERQKWDQIISMITGQIKLNKESDGQIVNVMKKILQRSQKNKEFLDSTQSVNFEGTNEINELFRTIPEDKNINDPQLFKKKKLQINIPELQAKQLSQDEGQISQRELISESCPVPRKENFHTKLEKQLKDEEMLFNKTGKLKAYISSNLQDDTITEMLKIREDLLEKRETEELSKLNKLLSQKQLSQSQFLNRLQSLTKKFKKEKEAIDKAKQDIEKGYKAAMNLMKQSFHDAKKLGFKLSMSRSQDNLKYKNAKTFMNEIVVDELTPKSVKKSMKDIFMQDESDNNSSVEFTEEELNRFRKIQANQISQLNYLNKNVLISDEFFKQQQALDLNEMKLDLQRQIYHLDEENKPQKDDKEELTVIVQKQLQQLALEFATEIITKTNMVEKFIDRTPIIKPSTIKQNQRLRFMDIISKNLPSTEVLVSKLNQKITPLPIEILKCMRLDFSEDIDEEEDNYEEISKYQFVISQQVCAVSVQSFKNQLQKTQSISLNESQQLVSLKKQIEDGNYSDQLKKFLTQRDKLLQNRKQHAKDLFWEVVNIEIHCIFDAWNEEIIQIKSEKPGFSGIGMNELSLSLVDHNRNVNAEKVEEIIAESKKAVVEALDPQTDFNTKILKQNYRQMCQNDSTWIFYADQALSYGLELVYLVEEDLYKEIEREMKKIIMKNLFN